MHELSFAWSLLLGVTLARPRFLPHQVSQVPWCTCLPWWPCRGYLRSLVLTRLQIQRTVKQNRLHCATSLWFVMILVASAQNQLTCLCDQLRKSAEWVVVGVRSYPRDGRARTKPSGNVTVPRPAPTRPRLTQAVAGHIKDSMGASCGQSSERMNSSPLRTPPASTGRRQQSASH